MKTKSVPFAEVALKAGPGDGLAEGEFVVYPSTFTREPDSYGDVVAKGAFANSIMQWKESGNSLPGLFGHRSDDPDYYVASALEMDEDDHGWRVKGKFDLDDPKAKKVYSLVKNRNLPELSFGYKVVDEAEVTLEDGRKANELREVKVLEFSFLPAGWAANPDTSVVAVKAAEIEEDVKLGRAISSKNESELRKAHDAIGRILASLENDQVEDSGDKTEVKSDLIDEEPLAKSVAEDEERKSDLSVRALALQIQVTMPHSGGEE